MNRWYWCDSSLTPGEAVRTTANGIRLYDGEKKSSFDDGRLTLTNLRLLWRHENQSSSLGLHLSLIVLIEEESGGFTSSPKLVLHLALPLHSQPSGPVASSAYSHIKLSFRQGGCSSFYQILQKAVGDREWERINSQSLPAPTRGSHAPGGRKIHTGILGIERDIQAKQEETSQNINRAFEDLKNLMTLAKDMVSLSRNISNKIKERSGDISADDTTQFRSYLLSLGIDDPVTRETFGSATEYHKSLAKEVVQALENAVKDAGGMMLLSEVYCRINRARGLQLLSPEDVVHACQVMQLLDLSLNLHTFESGVQVLQTAGLDQEEVIKETAEVLNHHETDGVSAGDLARECGVPLLLAQERLLEAERCAKAVRDESSEGLRFFPNLFALRGLKSMASASSTSAKNLFVDSKTRLAERVQVNINNMGSICRQVNRGSQSADMLTHSARNMALQEHALKNTEENLQKLNLLTTHLGYQHESIQRSALALENVKEQGNLKKGLQENKTMKLCLEFRGGAELLVNNVAKHSVDLEGSNWTVAKLLIWVKDNLVKERPELFLQGDSVRPGILVLINDADWELLGQLEYELQENDNVLFISTLHGG